MRSLIFDSDLNFPSDDFQALLLLASGDASPLVACTAVAGNTWMEEVWVNLRGSLHLIGLDDIPIGWGESHVEISHLRSWALRRSEEGVNPFVGAFEKSEAPRVSIELLQSSALSPSSSQLIGMNFTRAGRPVEVLATGPLTNVASALRRHPNFATRCEKMTIMGGHFGPSSVDGRPDFNFWFDPSAAQEVLQSGCPITLVPLELCRTVRNSDHFMAQITKHTGGLADIFHLDYRGMTNQHGMNMPLLDQLAAIVCLHPEMITESKQGYVEIDCTMERTRGRSRFTPGEEGPVQLVLEVDKEPVFKSIKEKLLKMSLMKHYPDNSHWKS